MKIISWKFANSRQKLTIQAGEIGEKLNLLKEKITPLERDLAEQESALSENATGTG